MSLVQDIAAALAQFEGYNTPGTLAQRNNNPGNLRSGIGQTGTDNGYAVFATADDGWNALYNQIQLYISRGLNLQQMIYTYAPPSDNNPTNNYLNFVAGKVGIPTDVPLSQLDASPPTDASVLDPSSAPGHRSTSEPAD
jgi:hypothetical protein